MHCRAAWTKVCSLALAAAQSGGPRCRVKVHESKRCKTLKETAEDGCRGEAAAHGEQWLLLKRLAAAADLS